jgi:hypothetical protein
MASLEKLDDRVTLADLAIALDKIRMCLENSLVNMTKTKNGHYDIVKIMMVIRDLDTVHRLCWKVEQDRKVR